MREKTHIDPDVSGLFVDYVRLRVAGHGLQTLLPLCWVVCDGDEEGRGQQDQLEFSLTAVQKHCPATRGSRETKAVTAASRLECGMKTIEIKLLQI